MNADARRSNPFKTSALYALALAALWPCMEAVRAALEMVARFHLTSDEGLHAELIHVLAVTGKYGVWAGDPFALTLTTGPTVIAPAAALQALTGLPAAVAGRIVVLSYFLGFLVFLVRTVYRLAQKEKVIAAATLGAFFLGWRSNYEMTYFLYGILGDGVGLFYICFSSYTFSKNRFFSAGILASLAALSKPYLILYPLTVAFVGVFLHLRDQKAVSLKSALRLWVGVALPFCGWIGWMLFQEGFHRTLEIWMNCFKQTGIKAISRDGYAQNGARELLRRTRNLWHLFKARSILLALTGVLLATRTRLGRHGLLLRVFAAVQIIWWFALSDGQQSRYVVPALFCGWLALAFSLPGILSHWTWFCDFVSLRKKYAQVFASVCLVLAFVPSVRELRKNRLDPDLNPFVGQMRLQEFWKPLSSTTSLVWSTNPVSFDGDDVIFLRAPHQVRKFDLAQNDYQALPKPGDLVLMAESSAVGTSEWIHSHHCIAVAKLPLKEYGFYKCP